MVAYKNFFVAARLRSVHGATIESVVNVVFVDMSHAGEKIVRGARMHMRHYYPPYVSEKILDKTVE